MDEGRRRVRIKKKRWRRRWGRNRNGTRVRVWGLDSLVPCSLFELFFLIFCSYRPLLLDLSLFHYLMTTDMSCLGSTYLSSPKMRKTCLLRNAVNASAHGPETACGHKYGEDGRFRFCENDTVRGCGPGKWVGVYDSLFWPLFLISWFCRLTLLNMSLPVPYENDGCLARIRLASEDEDGVGRDRTAFKLYVRKCPGN